MNTGRRAAWSEAIGSDGGRRGRHAQAASRRRRRCDAVRCVARGDAGVGRVGESVKRASAIPG
jgi:hypothetical protein